jgi:hypothetical protein
VAHHRHKRDTDARRLLTAKTVSAGIAFLATAPLVAAGVLRAAPAASDLVAATPMSASLSASTSIADGANRTSVADRVLSVSRSANRNKAAKDLREEAERTAATAKAVKKAHVKLWTTAPLNLWTQSGDDAAMLGVIPASRQVLVTGRQAGDRVEIVVAGKSRWVTDGYLSEDKPLGVGAGLSMAPCPYSGESGLTSNAVFVFRSVCHAFPQITSYGGWSNHGEHASGRAIDIMVSDVGLGTAIADFLRAHSSELHLYDVLWRQHIWTPVRAGEGWRYMSSRGSTTANHYDHVHVSVY